MRAKKEEGGNKEVSKKGIRIYVRARCVKIDSMGAEKEGIDDSPLSLFDIISKDKRNGR